MIIATLMLRQRPLVNILMIEPLPFFQENVSTNKFGTLGGTMTLRKTKYKEGEKEIDPKMEELKRKLNTEDGGKN